jgi:molybdate-binding protein
VTGEYNLPYASAILAGRGPVLVRLWRREQGIVISGNGCAVSGLEELLSVRVALRSAGTGTRVLLERLLRERGLDPRRLHGPEVGSHLDVGLAVASGVADAGVAVRSVAALLGLDFVPLTWEPFDLALPAEALGSIGPLLDAVLDGQVQARIAALGGYDLCEAGAIRRVA